MSLTETRLFSLPTRQSPVAIILILLRLVRTLFRQLWPLLLVLLFNPRGEVGGYITPFIIGIAAISALRSIISYFRYYFYIQDRELIIERGVLQHTRTAIPFDRIQSISLNQGPIHQLFGVSSLDIDTAGSSGSELSITALSVQEANQLRTYVLSQRAPISSQEVSDDESEEEVSPSIAPTSKKLLLELNIPDLLKIGVSQNHLRTAGILFAFSLSVLDDLEQVVGPEIYKMMEERFGEIFTSFIWASVILAVFFLIISFALSLLFSVLRNYQLRFYRTDIGFQMQAGLLDRREQTISLPKIQFIRWSANPFQRFFKLYRLRLYQASSIAVSAQGAMTVPGCYDAQLKNVQEAYFPDWSETEKTLHGVSRYLVRRRFIIHGLLPAGLFFLINLGSPLQGIIGGVFWLIFSYFWNVRYQRYWKIWLSEIGVEAHYGLLTRHRYLLHWRHLQSTKVRQSFIQKRLDVADLLLYTAAGTLHIPYLPVEKAKAIRDFILYRVESSQESWM
ncbi:MAG: PH domain-containing protein [Bacteroidota bacterium]